MAHEAPEATTPFLVVNKSFYDVLKFIAQILLPAIGALYFALGGIWDLPNGEEVVGTITAVDVFLGVIIAAMAASFNNSDAKYDGSVTIVPDPVNNTTSVKFNLDPSTIAAQKDAVLKVNTQ